MTTETIAEAGATAETNAPEVETANKLETSQNDTPAEQTEASTETDPIKALEQRIEKERQRAERRINRKHAEAAAANERVRALEAQLQRYETPQEQAEQTSTPADIDRIATERAAEMLTVQQVTQRSNAVFSAGVKAFGDSFGEAVASVIEDAGPLVHQNGKPTPLGEAILDADKPEALLHYLSQNPDDAEQLRGLSPAQVGRRIARIEAAMATTEPKRSNAPKPLAPVKGVSAPQGVDPSDTRRWIEAENARAAGKK